MNDSVNAESVVNYLAARIADLEVQVAMLRSSLKEKDQHIQRLTQPKNSSSNDYIQLDKQ